LLKYLLFLFLLLLKLEGLRLEHGKFRYSGQHFSGELRGASFIFVNFLSDFKSALAAI
jgi:hypothetical protein